MPKISGGFGNIQQQKEHLEKLIERLEKIKVPEVKSAFTIETSKVEIPQIEKQIKDKTLWQKIKVVMTHKVF